MARGKLERGMIRKQQPASPPPGSGKIAETPIAQRYTVEVDKALRELPREEKTRVLRAIAQDWYEDFHGEPDPAWEYGGAWETLRLAKRKLTYLINSIAEQEEVSAQKNQLFRQSIQQINQLMIEANNYL